MIAEVAHHYSFYRQSISFICTLQIKNKIDRRTNKVTEELPKNVKTGDACDVVLKPMRPLVVETFKAYPPLGRFAVRDMRMTVAVGVINSTVRKIPEVKGKK